MSATGMAGGEDPVLDAPDARCSVWWAATGVLDIQPLAGVLDPGESERLARLRRAEDRERFVIAAALVRAVVAQVLGADLAEVALDRQCGRCGQPHGKPRLVWPPVPLHLSITHSGRVVGVAISADGPVGVDVEASTRHTDDGVLSAALAPQEQAALDRLAPGPDRAAGFLRLWTRKEAVAKMAGMGLEFAFTDLRVTGPQEAPRLLDWPGDAAWPARVRLHDLDPGTPGHVAALATLDASSAPVLGDGVALLARHTAG